jgi:hypothetical protein
MRLKGTKVRCCWARERVSMRALRVRGWLQVWGSTRSKAGAI